MRRVLMISYYFPPQGGIGSVRAVRFVTHLPSFGWEVAVVSPRTGAYYEDPSLSLAETRVYRTGNLQLGRIISRKPRAEIPSSVSMRRGGVREVVKSAVARWVYRPDGQIGWLPFALAAGRRAVREFRPDVIFSSSFPITGHLVARRLRGREGIPWVAEFRDLWTDRGRGSPSRQRRDEKTERSMLADAAEVVTVSPAYAGALSSRGARRVSIVTNGFDPDEHPRPTGENGIVTYVGSYYPDRQDLGTAFRALGGLAKDGLVSDLRLRFVGDITNGIQSVISESGVADFVESTGVVPHSEAVRHICGSTLLLLAGPISAETAFLRGNIPGKTFEYLGSGRPILFIGDPTSDVAQLLRTFESVRIVASGDVDGARAAVLSLLRANDCPAESALQPFTSRHITSILADILDRVCR